MLNRFVLSCALLATFAAPVLRSQNSNETEGGQQSGQSAPGGCTDTMLAPGADCPPNQQQSPRPPYGQTGIPVPTDLGQTPSERNAQGPTRSNQPAPQLPAEEPTEFQKFVAETTGQFVPIYGEDLFRRVPSTFAPSNQVPVPPEYVIGPDDQLRIRIWGQINFSGNLEVDRSGNIYLPQIGAVQVAGLPFSALDQHLRSVVAKDYRNFDLSVEIGQIRSIQVYVSGQARSPGAYTISALSSLVDALFASGGPSLEGSLRHILLKREGRTVTDFDLYALLVHGDKSKDVRLLPEDVLYIPPAGPQVAITGSVRSPGIYELRSGETVGDLIEMAGRTTAVASDSRLSLERVHQHQSQETIEIGLDAAGLATVLADGDILRVDSIVPAYDKTVTLRGNVANPGRFSWRPGMRLSDLIPDLDSLVSRDYWWNRSHLGLPSPEFEPAISTLLESHQLAGSAITNAMRIPPQDLSSSSSTSTGGTNEQAANATVASDIGQTSSGLTSDRSIAQSEIQNAVRLSPDQINWNYAVIERVDASSLKPSLIPFDLGKLILDHDAAANLPLEPGDTVTVFSQSDIQVPLDQQIKYVELEGEFVHPGFYSVSPDETLRDLVRRAGGLTPRAYLYGSEFARESARILQQQRLDDYVRSLTLDAERGTQALAVSSTSSPSAASDVAASRSVTADMIARLSRVRATGRIVLEFHSDSSSLDDIPAISLENGDKFVVPFAPANVNVIGAVYDQNSYLYSPGRHLGYYLQLAGGTNRNADWRHAFLIRADGSVVSRTHIPSNGLWKESFNDLRLNPGDTIMVPDKTLRPTALRGFMDWSQLFSQLALGAAAINVL